MEQIPINKKGTKNIIFTGETIEFRGKKILYQEIESVSYSAVTHYYSFIPTGTIFSVTVKSAQEKIEAAFSAALNIGLAEKQKLFDRIINASRTYLEPILVEKLFQKVSLSQSEPLEIAGLYLSPQGFSAKKLLGSSETNPWKSYQGVTYEKGYQTTLMNIIISEEGQQKKYKSIALREKNAAVLPTLMKKCAEKF